MPELEWKAPAVADLMAIVDYISDDNPDAALALMEEIQSKVAQLPAHPKRCRSGRVGGTRELVVRPNYIVVYSETAETVTVHPQSGIEDLMPWRFNQPSSLAA